jgi:hypothetical protein
LKEIQKKNNNIIIFEVEIAKIKSSMNKKIKAHCSYEQLKAKGNESA